MLTLDLGGGRSALVDAQDWERVSGLTWYASAPDTSLPGAFYALAKPYDRETKRQPTLWMHRFILGAPRGMCVDHIDGNGLNNTRANLRLATPSQNGANSRRPAGLSGFRGVYLSRKRFAAYVWDRKRPIRVGVYGTAEEAARARDAAAIAMYGDFASLNFPRSA